MLALDTETYPISEGDVCPKLVCMTSANTAGPAWHASFDLGYQPIVGCNIAYDMAVLQEWAGWNAFDWYDKELVHDIAVREMLFDIALGRGTKRSYSLETLADKYLGIELEKDPAIRLTFHRGITDKHREYALKDAEVTYKIWQAQEQLADSDPHLRQALQFEHFECYAAFCLHLMEVWGMIADGAWVSQLLADVDVKYQKLLQQRRDIGVLRENGTQDKKKLAELVTAAYKGNPPRTDKGHIKTDRLTLEESNDPLLESLTGDGPIEKIVTTYGKVIQAASQNVYNPRYDVLVSSGRTGGNFQQWPRGGQKAPPEITRLRACFVPRRGRRFCAIDLQAAELVSLAEVCYRVIGWSKLRDAINAGQDLHTALAARLAGISYEEALALVKAGDKRLTDLRQSCKPINFGLPGMMGAFRLVQAAQKEGTYFCELAGIHDNCPGSKCRDCLNLAYRYIRVWKEQWPEIPLYHAWIQCQNLDPFLDPITGWVSGGLYPSEAANRPFQHLTSRAAKKALIAVTRACYDPSSVLFGAKPCMFAHDEIMLELDEERASEQGEYTARIVQSAAQEVTPNVTTKAEPVLMTRWWKGAKPVYKDGKLVVWEPK